MTYHQINEIPVKVHGRTTEGACPLPIFWSRSGIEVASRASELWVDIEVGCDTQEPWFVTEINGCFMSRQMVLPGRHKICLYRKLSPSEVRNVRFYKDSQMVAGDDRLYVMIHGLETDGTFEPVASSDFRIEYVGDSITSGEGTYGSDREIDWRSMFMSSSRQYAAYIEKALGAESRVISHGGWGVYSSWDNDVRCNLPSVYERVCGIAAGEMNERMGAQQPYDFSSWIPDAIIVNLCTNDATAFDQPPFEVPGRGSCKQRRNPDGTYHPEDIGRVIDAVTDFLRMIRRHNPTSHILWVYGMLGYDLTLPVCEGVNRYIAESGDHNVAFINLPNTTEETVGSFGHPGVLSHERAAAVLCEYLSARFNRPIHRERCWY